MITRTIAEKLTEESREPCRTLKEVDKRLRDNFKSGSINAIIDIDNKNGFGKKVIKKLEENGFKVFGDIDLEIMEMDVEI